VSHLDIGAVSKSLAPVIAQIARWEIEIEYARNFEFRRNPQRNEFNLLPRGVGADWMKASRMTGKISCRKRTKQKEEQNF
jgi:hypothetical protein